MPKKKSVHEAFREYMDLIVHHEAYSGMPDAIRDDGTIQWEAPSNRKSGKYKDTHHRRREWWRQKAIAEGISPSSARWISRTAKQIHPTKRKPCHVCGRYMDISYSYPTRSLIRRIRRLEYVDDAFQIDPLEHITDLVTRLFNRFGSRVLLDLPSILQTGQVDPPALGDLQSWLDWIRDKYIPLEPRTLSPGAMSNAPDRLDGFHTYNICCRQREDRGRHQSNLSAYVTDRRVFQYWNQGDWIAADRLMGRVRSEFGGEACLHGHEGPCNADHIGPLSLGFAHRPEFQFLCSPCNSAKNNRMMLSDVVHLRLVDAAGGSVMSWYGRALWELRRDDVVDEETALRLSKLLRDNRHNAMAMLMRIAQAGHFAFLATLLELHRADYDVDFRGLRVQDHITRFDELVRTPRTTQYALEQKARACRVAYESLHDYARKRNRNAYLVLDEEVEDSIRTTFAALEQSSDDVRRLDQAIEEILSRGKGEGLDPLFRMVVQSLPSVTPDNFEAARQALAGAMELVARTLSGLWEDERYVRAPFDFDV